MISMKEEVVCEVGGVGLTESQLALLQERQITLSMLEKAAANSDTEAMRLYIHDLLDSRGGHADAAGPEIDNFSGNSD